MKVEGSIAVGRGDGGGVVAQASLTIERLSGLAVDERDVVEVDSADRELIATADNHLVRRCVDMEHVPGPRLRQAPETGSLTDGVKRGTSMLAECATIRVHHLTCTNRQVRGQVARRPAARDEADLLAVGLVSNRETELARVLSYLG